MDAETSDAAPHAAARPDRRLTVLLLGLAAVVLTVDQLLKHRMLALLAGDPAPTPVIEGWLQLRLTFNSGAAFSMGTGSTWIFTVIATVVSLVIVRLSLRVGSRGWAVALGLLLGGATGNLGDRLFRQPGFGRGHVVDFVESMRLPWPGFPVFNLADACIVLAACTIALLGFRGIAMDGSRATADLGRGTGA